jgi:tetratricopeptide (TPR) repeat protein
MRTGRVRCWILAASLALLAGSAFAWRRWAPPSEAARLDAAYALGDWQAASTVARERLKADPDDPLAIRLAARVAARQDQDQRALAIYERVPEADRAAEDLFLIGRARVRLGQGDAGTRALEAARELAPDHPEVLAAIAGLYLQSDRNESAAATAERLAHLPGWEARGHLLLGTARAASRDPAGAALALQRWMELDPRGQSVAPSPAAPIRKLLARSWLEAEHPGEARGVLESVLADGPDPEASWLLSRCFIQEKDWSKAASALRQAANFRADNPLMPEPAPYVGEARCARCHRPEHAAVLASRHAATFSRARDLEALPLPDEPLVDPGNPEVSHRFRREGETMTVETRTGDRLRRAVIEYALGSVDRFTTFVGRDEQGQPRMIRMSPYHSDRGHGWDLATGLPPRPEGEDEYLGKKMFDADGLRRCLNCHTTNPRAVLAGHGPEAADASIGCEQCHGPGANHLAAVAASFSDPAIDSSSTARPAEVDRMCAKCHGNHQPERVGRPRTDPIWYRFQSVSLGWSRCYNESDGAMGCITCHDPHSKLETSAAWYEARCLSCHGAAAAPAEAPSAPAARPVTPPRTPRTVCPVNPRQDCLKCHLPTVWVPSTHTYKADHYIRVREKDPPAEPPKDSEGRGGHE